VYIDETGIDTFVRREYAYSKRGVKIISRTPGKKYKRVGIVAAKSSAGVVSPLQYDGTMDSALFERWFELRLIPKLPPNSTAILDNASFHNKKRLISLAEKHGHKVIFLPPYSPELNLIENFWSWLKNKLKKVLPECEDFNAALRYCFNVV
jgi:transposase